MLIIGRSVPMTALTLRVEWSGNDPSVLLLKIYAVVLMIYITNTHMDCT